MEGLMIAQVLADLSDLQTSDPTAALNLLNANQTLSDALLQRKSRHNSLPEPPKFDRLGRRIVGPIVTTPSILRSTSTMGNGFFPPPNMTRKNSSLTDVSAGSSGGNSGAQTPMRGISTDEDIDIERAKALIHLYEMRDRFKQQEATGLTKAREKVNAVVAKYAQQDLEEKEKAAKARHLRV